MVASPTISRIYPGLARSNALGGAQKIFTVAALLAVAELPFVHVAVRAAVRSCRASNT